MKKMKKFVSLILAAVMVMAMTVVAFAEGDASGTTTKPGSITVSNPVKGKTYTAYKIFDVVYNDKKDAYAYSIQSTSDWFDDIEEYKDKKGTLSLNQVNNGTQYVVKTTGNFSASDFANYLNGKIDGKTGRTLTAEGDVVTARNLDLGYYFVSSGKGAICNLTTTDPTVTIHDKNDVPFNKVDDKSTVAIGEVVTYTITGKVPNTTGFNKYEYTITDKMSEGLTFNDDVKIKVDGVDLTNNYVYTKNANGNGFTLSIDVKADALQAKVGKAITVTYTATVNEKAAGKISKNGANLTYTNDPTTEQTTTTTNVEETVYSAKIIINKFETGNAEKTLAGAKFVLKNSGGKFYKYAEDEENPGKMVVSWVDTQADATTVTTDDNGAGEFLGLVDGTYYLVETKAPEGYNMLTGPITITINGKNAKENNAESMKALAVEAEVENSTGSLLPSTGGIGTTIFYVLGGILVLGAAVVLVTKRRMNEK